MAFGPVGRSWQPRIRWAGTYDQKWMDEKFPFLPEDFDERYYQCRPRGPADGLSPGRRVRGADEPHARRPDDVPPAGADGSRRVVLPQDRRNHRSRGQLGYVADRTRPAAIHARVAGDVSGAAHRFAKSCGSSSAAPPAIGKRSSVARPTRRQAAVPLVARDGRIGPTIEPSLMAATYVHRRNRNGLPRGIERAGGLRRDAGEDLGVQRAAVPRQPGRADRRGRGPRPRGLSAQGGRNWSSCWRGRWPTC